MGTPRRWFILKIKVLRENRGKCMLRVGWEASIQCGCCAVGTELEEIMLERKPGPHHGQPTGVLF
jgi:hypothetical protein